MAEHSIAVIGIKPDMGADENLDGDSKSEYDARLDDAWEAAKDDDKAGWLANMRAAIKACIEDYESSEEPKEDEDY